MGLGPSSGLVRLADRSEGADNDLGPASPDRLPIQVDSAYPRSKGRYKPFSAGASCGVIARSVGGQPRRCCQYWRLTAVTPDGPRAGVHISLLRVPWDQVFDETGKLGQKLAGEETDGADPSRQPVTGVQVQVGAPAGGLGRAGTAAE